MQTHFLALFVIAGVLGVAGCGTSSESDRRWLQLPPDSAEQGHASVFETRMDTVAVQQQKERPAQGALQQSTGARFAVQIGSFRIRRNASEAQALARQRFQLPVVSDYNSARRSYQIRVGFFSTREEAMAFRTRIVNEYPREYGDAWIVRIAP